MKTLEQNQNAKINSQDYLLVIEPSEEVISEVKDCKAKAQELIGPFRSFKSKAHITVNHYYDDNALFFDDRMAIYRNMVSRINSFHIKVCGFDYFEHQNTYTIYAKVELNPSIKEAFHQLRKIFGSDVRNTPHITIARALSFAQFKILWDYFKNRKFECSFYTEEIVVLTAPTTIAYHAAMEIKTEFKFKNAG
jgi:2'-5' RNA ligase